jgi:hypothetical protein
LKLCNIKIHHRGTEDTENLKTKAKGFKVLPQKDLCFWFNLEKVLIFSVPSVTLW